MPPKKSKEKKADVKHTVLTRRPLRSDSNLYPDLQGEKENLNSSSDDSPTKVYLETHSPKFTRKSNSPSSMNSFQDATNFSKHRGGRHEPKQTSPFQDCSIQNNYSSEDDDVEMDNVDDMLNMEMDNFDNISNPRQIFENSQNEKKFVSPSSNRRWVSTEAKTLIQSNAPPKIQSQRMESSDSIFINIWKQYSKFIFCGLLILIGVSIVYNYWFNMVPSTMQENKQLKASILVKNLKANFKDQPPLTFRIVGSALKNVLDAEPTSPAIILLLATNDSKTVCDDLALTLVKSLSVPEHSIQIPGEKYKQANVQKAKLEIEKLIDNTLKVNKLGSVLIYDLDQIPGQAAIILHKYYDHENAPFKKAVFVMTANYDKPISDHSNPKVWDKVAYDHLLSAWTDIGVDQSSALLSRLTVSVAVIMNQALK